MEHIEAFGWIRADNGEASLGVRVRDPDDQDAKPRLGHLFVCSNSEHRVGSRGGLVEFHPVDDQETFFDLLQLAPPKRERNV